ncbi:MAG: sulfatase-like hydrolase/transferase, partial [Anaerolineae bacterium]
VNDLEQPWFLAVNFITPHDIMFDNMGEEHEATMLNMVAAAETELYQQEWDVTLPASFGENSDEHPAGVAEFRRVNGRFQGCVPIENTKAWKRYINYYLNCYRDVDQHLGTVIDGLEAAGQLDNTVIIFTSDHGDMGGAHNLREKGSILFREVVNTPLIVSHPDGPDGQTTSAVGSALDLAPTILSLAGVTTAERKERHPQLKGVDLSDVILGHDQTGPRGNAESPGKGALYTYDNLFTYDFGWFASHLNRLLSDAPVVQMEESNKPVITDPTKIFTELGAPDLNKRNMIRGIFDGRYKLIRYFSIGNYHLPADVDTLLKNNDVALYDLVIDPHEMVNLARVDHPDYDKNLLATMNTKLNDLIESEIGLDENKVGI